MRQAHFKHISSTLQASFKHGRNWGREIFACQKIDYRTVECVFRGMSHDNAFFTVIALHRRQKANKQIQNENSEAVSYDIKSYEVEKGNERA